MSHRPRSSAAFETACQVIPGGVNSPVRAFTAVGGQPLVIDRGEGPFLYDLDGQRYIDYVGSWGPLILGHAHPAIVQAITQTAQRGTSFGAPCELETQLAQLIAERVPSIEKVRFVNSGTEATMSAIRLARGVTNRDVIIKFSGCYHGHGDCLLADAGSGVATLGIPSCAGVPASVTGPTWTAPFNDLAAVKQLVANHRTQIAAIILEPIAGNMGVIPPEPGFLEGLRQLCSEIGALLIFDEVMTGFRVAPGGAQSLYDVLPDLTTLGKVIGGGMPVGAYGGPTQIMDQIAPLGPVYQAGTLSGNPLAMAAGLATLKELTEERYEQLEFLSGRLATGLFDAAKAAGITTYQTRVGSMQGLFFHDGPVYDYSAARASDTDRFAQYFHGMLTEGVYLACSAFEAMFVSTSHTEQLVDQTVTAAERVLSSL